MPATFFDGGLSFLNSLVLGQNSYGNLKVLLFVNDETLDFDTVLSDVVECTIDGYSNITLDPGEWSGGASGGVYTATYPNITFTFDSYSGPEQTIYGAIVYNSDADLALWGQRLETPVEIPLAGGILTLAVNYVDGACPGG